MATTDTAVDERTVAASGSLELSNTIVAVLVPLTHETVFERAICQAHAGVAKATTIAGMAIRVRSRFMLCLTAFRAEHFSRRAGLWTGFRLVVWSALGQKSWSGGVELQGFEPWTSSMPWKKLWR